ncbi:MAG: hypothetical protein WCK67_05485 [bacterium]
MNPYQAQIQTRKPLLIFLKHVGPPVVLYIEDVETAYNEVKKIITTANPQAPKLIEKIGNGPLKKVAILDTQIAGVAIQEENFVGQ